MGKSTFLRPILYSIVLCIGLLIGFYIPNTPSNKFKEVLDIVGKDYVDSVGDDLESQMLTKYLSSLDPHSIYIPSKYFKYAQESLSGNYVGIGIEFDVIDSFVFVTRVVPTSPAEKEGIEAGDQILQANATGFSGEISYTAVIEALKGPEEEVLVLRIRKKDDAVVTYNVQRNTVPNSSIRASFVQGDIGYINFSRFSTNSHEEFLEALNKLKEIGFKTLVIDLRGNGGGFLNEAQKIANEFLAKGQLIAYIQGRNRKKQKFEANGKGIYQEGKLVFLTNSKSASASEILAGAMQDHDRATIIGKPTYGKGLVQESYYFKDSSTMKLTVARYYLPTGRSIQKSYSTLQDSLNADTFYTLVKQRKMVDGNGIHPDITFPIIDTNKRRAESLWLLRNSSITDRFIYTYYVPSKMESMQEFVSNFNIPKKDIKLLMEEVEIINNTKFPMEDKIFMQEAMHVLRDKVAYSYYGLEYYYYSKVLSEGWKDFLSK